MKPAVFLIPIEYLSLLECYQIFDQKSAAIQMQKNTSWEKKHKNDLIQVHFPEEPGVHWQTCEQDQVEYDAADSQRILHSH